MSDPRVSGHDYDVNHRLGIRHQRGFAIGAGLSPHVRTNRDIASAPSQCTEACRHSVSIWSGQAPHLSVAHVQLILQGHVLRVCISQRGRLSKASSFNPCERCLAEADNVAQPLYKVGWCLHPPMTSSMQARTFITLCSALSRATCHWHVIALHDAQKQCAAVIASHRHPAVVKAGGRGDWPAARRAQCCAGCNRLPNHNPQYSSG